MIRRFISNDFHLMKQISIKKDTMATYSSSDVWAKQQEKIFFLVIFPSLLKEEVKSSQYNR
ncbi:hypothetical protein SLEP1_g16650 [Rubroshorea leprosula]|uniref:Uncharacterized protein n=1 Tax=Rubroshorea leprosula TaxID=152421 RepID=A0AAV5J0M0_9ROSI|nr:hypothetical protein SLEP1_g16650 [Rubroshorea leprosula]